jgi:GNAT superfamily N-acetyltransferase
MGKDFSIRIATPADAAIIAWHRARMFQDMGELPPPVFEVLRTKAEAYLVGALRRGEVTVAERRRGIVLNVFTEPAWRRCGLAEQLMRQLLAWAQKESLDRLVLHASVDGRQLYERLGFVATNEMRFAGTLRP